MVKNATLAGKHKKLWVLVSRAQLPISNSTSTQLVQIGIEGLKGQGGYVIGTI